MTNNSINIFLQQPYGGMKNTIFMQNFTEISIENIVPI